MIKYFQTFFGNTGKHTVEGDSDGCDCLLLLLSPREDPCEAGPTQEPTRGPMRGAIRGTHRRKYMGGIFNQMTGGVYLIKLHGGCI